MGLIRRPLYSQPFSTNPSQHCVMARANAPLRRSAAFKDENATTSRDPISARPGIANYRFKQSPLYIMAFSNIDDVVQEQNIIKYNYKIVI